MLPDSTPNAPALFTRPSLNFLLGTPGSRKTWLAIDLAVCLATGQPWLDNRILPPDSLQSGWCSQPFYPLQSEPLCGERFGGQVEYLRQGSSSIVGGPGEAHAPGGGLGVRDPQGKTCRSPLNKEASLLAAIKENEIPYPAP